MRRARADARKWNNQVTFKNCASFTNCIDQINDSQIDNSEYLGIVMPIYNRIECIDSYAKPLGRLWQYHKDIWNKNIANLKSFRFKAGTTGRTSVGGSAKNVEIVLLLKYLDNFWRTFEILLINYEINLQLRLLMNCVITNSKGVGTFAITDTKLYFQKQLCQLHTIHNYYNNLFKDSKEQSSRTSIQ